MVAPGEEKRDEHDGKGVDPRPALVKLLEKGGRVQIRQVDPEEEA